MDGIENIEVEGSVEMSEGVENSCGSFSTPCIVADAGPGTSQDFMLIGESHDRPKKPEPCQESGSVLRFENIPNSSGEEGRRPLRPHTPGPQYTFGEPTDDSDSSPPSNYEEFFQGMSSPMSPNRTRKVGGRKLWLEPEIRHQPGFGWEELPSTSSTLRGQKPGSRAMMRLLAAMPRVVLPDEDQEMMAIDGAEGAEKVDGVVGDNFGQEAMQPRDDGMKSGDDCVVKVDGNDFQMKEGGSGGGVVTSTSTPKHTRDEDEEKEENKNPNPSKRRKFE